MQYIDISLQAVRRVRHLEQQSAAPLPLLLLLSLLLGDYVYAGRILNLLHRSSEPASCVFVREQSNAVQLLPAVVLRMLF